MHYKTRYWRKIEGRIEATGRQRRRREQLLNDLNETCGWRKCKEKISDRTLKKSPWKKEQTWRNTKYKIKGWCTETSVCVNDYKKGARNEKFRINNNLFHIYSLFQFKAHHLKSVIVFQLAEFHKHNIHGSVNAPRTQQN